MVKVRFLARDYDANNCNKYCLWVCGWDENKRDKNDTVYSSATMDFRIHRIQGRERQRMVQKKKIRKINSFICLTFVSESLFGRSPMVRTPIYHGYGSGRNIHYYKTHTHNQVRAHTLIRCDNIQESSSK